MATGSNAISSASRGHAGTGSSSVTVSGSPDQPLLPACREGVCAPRIEDGKARVERAVANLTATVATPAELPRPPCPPFGLMEKEAAVRPALLARFDRPMTLELFEVAGFNADHAPDFPVSQPLGLAPIPDGIGHNAEAFSYLCGGKEGCTFRLVGTAMVLGYPSRLN